MSRMLSGSPDAFAGMFTDDTDERVKPGQQQW
jgi:hypothetical protein